MTRRYAVAIACQAGAYCFIVVVAVAVLGFLPPTSRAVFIAFGAAMMAATITPLFLKCERCGENYFYDRATADRYGSFNLHKGYNLLKPVRSCCQACGFDRRQARL